LARTIFKLRPFLNSGAPGSIVSDLSVVHTTAINGRSGASDG
jgi:hypothetical protein